VVFVLRANYSLDALVGIYRLPVSAVTTFEAAQNELHAEKVLAQLFNLVHHTWCSNWEWRQ